MLRPVNPICCLESLVDNPEVQQWVNRPKNSFQRPSFISSDKRITDSLLADYSSEQLQPFSPSNSSLMVDWVSCKVPFFHAGKINGGNVISTTPDGEVEYCVDKMLAVKGSHDNRLSVRTIEVLPSGDTWLISISGNPVKWFQGHNIFGSDDLVNLVYETVLRLSELLKSPQPESMLSNIRSGCFTLSRIDINGMYSLGRRSDVYNWLHFAELNARTRHGTAVSKGNTVYFGKTSERWSVKCYSKGSEIEKHKLPVLLQDSSLPVFADDKLRIELTLRSKELIKLGLQDGSNWLTLDLFDIYKEYVGRIEMSNQTVARDLIYSLPKFARAAFVAWDSGHDVRLLVGRSKYYKDRKELLKHGIDISIPKPQDDSFINVVPLKRVLEMKPVGVPDWAMGTPLYFEPRSLCKVC